MAPCTMNDAADFLGLRFDRLAQRQVVELSRARDPEAAFGYIVTPNVDHVVRLWRTRSDLWPAYRHAWLTLCDSRILAKLAARAGLSLLVTTGSDLTHAMVCDGIDAADRIAVVGGSRALVDDLRDRYGFSRLVHHDPPMGFIHDARERAIAVDFVVGAQARYTFFAVGSPQQELLAFDVALTKQARGLGLCVGASLDFLAGRQVRAPRLVQQMSLEWLYRLATDPARLWRRYLVEGPVIFALFYRWQHARRRRV